MKDFMKVFCGIGWIVLLIIATTIAFTTEIEFAMWMWCIMALITSPFTVPTALKDISDGLGL